MLDYEIRSIDFSLNPNVVRTQVLGCLNGSSLFRILFFHTPNSNSLNFIQHLGGLYCSLSFFEYARHVCKYQNALGMRLNWLEVW